MQGRGESGVRREGRRVDGELPERCVQQGWILGLQLSWLKAGDGDLGSSVHGSGRDDPGWVTGREKDPSWTPGKMKKINQEMRPGRLEAKERRLAEQAKW